MNNHESSNSASVSGTKPTEPEAEWGWASHLKPEPGWVAPEYRKEEPSPKAGEIVWCVDAQGNSYGHFPEKSIDLHWSVIFGSGFFIGIVLAAVVCLVPW